MKKVLFFLILTTISASAFSKDKHNVSNNNLLKPPSLYNDADFINLINQLGQIAYNLSGYTSDTTLLRRIGDGVATTAEKDSVGLRAGFSDFSDYLNRLDSLKRLGNTLASRYSELQGDPEDIENALSAAFNQAGEERLINEYGARWWTCGSLMLQGWFGCTSAYLICGNSQLCQDVYIACVSVNLFNYIMCEVYIN